jgi:PAS domain S-box-containing protein
LSPNSDARHIRRLLRWLRERQHHFDLAAQCAGLGEWSWDLVTNEVTWSERCRELLGVLPGVPTSLEAGFAVVHPEDRADVAREFSSARNDRTQHDHEYRIVLPDGRVRWLHNAWQTLFDDRGVPERALGVLRDVTERRAAEEARVLHTQHLQHFIDATPAGVAMLDRELRFLVANRHYLADAQLTDEPLLGRSLCDVFPNLPQQWRDSFARCLEGETQRASDELWTRRDGSVVWINRICFPWYDERNAIGGVVLLIDVLSHDRHLEAQGRLWAETFVHSTRGIAIVEAGTDLLRSANRSFAQTVGYELSELAGRAALEVFPEAEHERITSAARSADAEGAAHLETCQLHRDGTLIPVEVSIVSVRDAADRLNHRILTVTDSRERLQVEGELRHRKAQLLAAERFRQLADAAPIGIILTDAEGACTYANASWLTMADMSMEQARDLGWWDAIHPEDRELVTEAWEGLARGVRFDRQFRYQRSTGESRWVHARASAIRDGEAISGFICAEVDVTEQLLQREALERFHGRVRSLAQRLDVLREEERRELATLLQGGLREDMTSLKLEASALRAMAPDERTAASVDRLLELAEGALKRVREIGFELSPPGIEELGFENALRRYAEERAAQAGLEIRLTLAASLPELGQRRLAVVYRTFQEALTNAIRHAQAKRVDVGLAVHEQALRLRVSDDGVGLKEQDRSKPGCFGLLAASERLASIGGALRVFGVAGTGTTVEVSVPLGRARRRADSAES